MKSIAKWFLRVAALALALILALTLLPYAPKWLASLLPKGRYDQVSTLLTHEMQKAGELTAVRHKDTGLMKATTSALLIGQVQKVSVPYVYEIGLGISLSEVVLTPTETGITVTVPPTRMLYDSFQITGEPEVEDFWYRLTEGRYQEMLNSQAAQCRADYLQNAAYQQEAWDAACEALKALLAQWAGEQLPLRFTPLVPDAE